MSTKVEEAQFSLDWLKWLVVIAIVLGGAVANSFYAGDLALYLRALVLIVLGGVAAFIAVNTAKGNAFWNLLKAAQVEVRKVVWPSRQETTQTTLIVAVVVVVTALILWGLDTGLGYLASLIIG
ncbi:preprotein translocase subunit SecE [Teredinibacter turnerae]|uniref:Protein translocase subunit SecE n=1 Tax=Teredinibacter turnerae (strain ATCC 39867 / T7901) TaxID=377629 RepID=C5BPQ0_TERTT|nr:preprotein translocase subunit SecE [Teredinibacter turnerae]ACR13657.1 preprotein translocase, SecE subunit [Teredinibacter turnerae T7901]